MPPYSDQLTFDLSNLTLNQKQHHAPPSTPPSTVLSHPSSTQLSDDNNKAATVFPSHVRASYRRNPTDRTGEIVRLLDDISVVTHAISSFLLLADRSKSPCIDTELATRRLYSSLCHDGYACIILEKSHEAPLTFSASALQGGYVVMLSALDVDPDTTDQVVCGTVFSVYRRKSATSLPGRLEDLQQHVANQVAAGYVTYSSATVLRYTMGAGTYAFCLHPVARQYFLQPAFPLTLPPGGTDLYVDYRHARNDPRLGASALAFGVDRRATMFDYGCLIANFSGAVASGSLVLAYHVHLLCEAAPLAFLVEQMGGSAVDAHGTRILDMVVADEDVHRKITFCAGPAEIVDAVEAQAKTHSASHPSNKTAPDKTDVDNPATQ
eukprot:GFKZ01013735.1.p2 GENE.GFKZ01013735.1~~GFKZ01013735.1.p2  ORF type:complete len:380 (+),score=50.05 GFKZ01013735.1:3-1142(+)